MKTLIQVLSTIIVLSILNGCGSNGSSTPETAGASTEPKLGATGCPIGAWYSINGYSDFVMTTENGAFSMKDKVGPSSTGTVSCSGTNITMTILSNDPPVSSCNGITNQCTTDYYSQKTGTYQCTFSLSTSLFQVYCPVGDVASGNVFNPARVYLR